MIRSHHAVRKRSNRIQPRASLLVAAILMAATAAPAYAVGLPSGFQDTVVFAGLDAPTAIRFAPDGRVFVAEKKGVVKVFDGLTDPAPDVLVDLSPLVHDYWDRGLLGLAVDPSFPARPYVYVLYTYDYDPATPALPAPRWGDTCPDPPGATGDGCVATGRLSRLQVGPGNVLIGGEHVLLENNWCIQYVTHSVGDLAFDDEGALLVSAGDGASFDTDFGQHGGTPGSGIPVNPCGDPPGGRGGAMTAPTAEGGALRAQDLATSGDPLTLDGSLLRIHPDTGAAWPDNPLIGGDPADDRFVAYGLRNPFRFALRPGTDELWIGDVGWDDWEEIDRLPSLHGSAAENFGWPCFEGAGHQSAYDAAGLAICETLYVAGQGATRSPFFSYRHGQQLVPGGDSCGTGSSAVSGLAFYPAGTWPIAYHDALFFADYGRDCIFAMPRGAGADPDPALVQVFALDAVDPVDLEVGPGGDLFYVSIGDGNVHRISYTAGNTPPTAVATAVPSGGPVPLLVQFDASGSSDPDVGAVLTYAWDLDGDGQLDDSTAIAPQFTYDAPGNVAVRVRVEDEQGATGEDVVLVTPGNTAPVATILTPTSALTWRVGDEIAFSGQGTDAEDGTIAPSALHWDVRLHHCPGGSPQCHVHTIEQIDGVSQGALVAPDHEWYSFLEIRLRVTDSGGLSSTAFVEVVPQSVAYTFESVPPGLSLVVGSQSAVTPFMRSLIVGSSLTISAPTPQASGGDVLHWLDWSDGGEATHPIVALATSQTVTATFVAEKILYVSAHPDDDVLSAAGVIARARDRGIPVRVAYVTNGDLTGGVAMGLTREGEAVSAQGVLGVAESDLVFLGYPDSALAELRSAYPNPGDRYTAASGQSETYGNRGLGGTDYHTYRFGTPAAYNAANLRADLTDLIGSFRPTHIVTLSEWDRHPDHAATYLFVSEALGEIYSQDPTYVPTVHSTIVWNDQPSATPVWPPPRDAATPFTEPPVLASTNLDWADRESLDVPIAMQSTDYGTNPKNQAIDAHVSQGGALLFFGRFVHKDEIFWSENLLGPNQPPVPDAGTDQTVGHGTLAQLHGGASFDPEGQALRFRWRQVAGPTVALSSPEAADPTFVSPVASQSLLLAFELLVSDGEFVSLPDMAIVRVRGAVNVAPAASVTASSETVETGQTAWKAVDGVPSGYPVDYTREWATNGQRAEAWIDLAWSRRYCVEKATLYDRPNLSDHILAGTLLWSDATSVAVGTLDNAGAATDVAFPARVVTGVRFTVDAVSPETENVGLAELEVYRCVESDPDGDDWLAVEGDCDDADPLRNPGLPEVPYNGTDDDCDAATRDDDLDEDGWLAPDDCDDANPLVNPSRPEVPYSGIDEDCDPATPDNDLDGDGFGNETDCDDLEPLVHQIPSEIVGAHVDSSGTAAVLTWHDQGGVTGPETVYDVLSGSLAMLIADGGFQRATCLGWPTTESYTDDRPNPGAGEARYYLVRGTNSCGSGTYGNSRATPDPRDGLDGASPCGAGGTRPAPPLRRGKRLNLGGEVAP